VAVDWFVVLTPLLLVVVVLPFVFVGCEPFGTSTQPGTTATQPPDDGTTTPVATQTTFRLEMDPNLQLNVANPLVRIEVTWLLESSTGAVPTIVVPQPAARITTKQQPRPDPPAIDPVKDEGVSAKVASADIGPRDRVRCECRNTQSNNNTGTSKSDAVVLEKDKTYEFRIQSRRPAQAGFRVYHNGA
jgi:hypothetical protein